MDTQRAINNLACIKMEIQDAMEDVRKSKKIRIDTIDVAIAALKKKLPKKPLLVLGGNTNKLGGDIFICPLCSGIVGIADERADYCADCGQTLDWS